MTAPAAMTIRMMVKNHLASARTLLARCGELSRHQKWSICQKGLFFLTDWKE
jgi:hypothetical protein